jgi:hypothetical protein
MYLLIALALAVAAVPLFGGRLRALSDLRFRAPWLLFAALGILGALLAFPGEENGVRTGLYLATYPLGVAFVVLNRRVPGLWIVGLGALLNFVVIAANGGVMPASAQAMRTAGLVTEPGVYANSAILAHPKLAFLGDVFALPRSLPLANVYSIGDLIIVFGAAYTVHRVSGSRLGGRRRSPDTADAKDA